jgi:hypothetical protein
MQRGQTRPIVRILFQVGFLASGRGKRRYSSSFNTWHPKRGCHQRAVKAISRSLLDAAPAGALSAQRKPPGPGSSVSAQR